MEVLSLRGHKTHEGTIFQNKGVILPSHPPPRPPVSPRAPPEETLELREGTEEAMEAAGGPMEATQGAPRPMAMLPTGPMPEGDDTLHTEGAPPRDTCAATEDDE